MRSRCSVVEERRKNEMCYGAECSEDRFSARFRFLNGVSSGLGQRFCFACALCALDVAAFCHIFPPLCHLLLFLNGIVINVAERERERDESCDDNNNNNAHLLLSVCTKMF